MVACLGAMAFGGDYVVIVNSASPLGDISSADLKRVYTGKIVDIGGTQVTIANLSLDNPAAESFLMEITGKSSSDYKSHWMALQIRGGSTAPLVKKTPEEMVAFVKESVNNIGYVPKDAPVEGVKVVTVK